MITYASGTALDGIYLHTRHDGKLFDLKRLWAKPKVACILIREMLYADDDAVLVSHTQDGLQYLMDKFSKACKEFALSIKKTEVMAQDAEIPPSIYIDGWQLQILGINYLWQSVARCGDKCPHWESSHSNGQIKQKGLAEHQSDNEYQTQRLSGMCNQHTPL